MKANRFIPVLLGLLLAGMPAAAQTMGVSRGHDLDALWSRAQADHDLKSQDAVVLLESRQVTVQANGDVAVGVHRLVWIGTSLGIRAYADLRVPWNSGNAELEVQILRTWRDGKWWPDADRISETAVVHTLPYALQDAYDYADRRETMLLHDGVELPCLMETAYTITGRGQTGAADLFLMAQNDPAVLVELKVQAPAGTRVWHQAANQAPAAEVVAGEGTSLVWTMHDLPALRHPLTGAPAAYEPCVWWSTWPSDEVMIDTWRGSFDAAAAAAAAVADEIMSGVAEKTRAVAGGVATARTMAAYIEETVRTVHYAGDWAPRPADRVWQTAYGHPLDKAVLVAGLLRHQGYVVEPVFAGHRLDSGAVMVPGLAGLGRLQLVITLPGQPSEMPLVYDADHGSLGSLNRLAGRRVVPMATPFEATVPGLDMNLLRVEIALGADDEGGWRGRGYVDAGGDLAFGDLNVEQDAGVSGRVAAIVAAVLPGALGSGTEVLTLTDERVGAEFQVALAPDEAPTGAITWVIGEPVGGLTASLPADVQLSAATRASPVLLGLRRAQVLAVRCDLQGKSVAYVPAPRRIVNAAGAFEVKSETRDGWLYYERVLTLEPGPLAATQWPDLRALLLEEADPANGTIRLLPEAAAN